MGIEKPYHRKEYEELSNKQQEEKKEFIDKAHEEALKDEQQRLKELSKGEMEIKGAKLEKPQELKGEISLEKAQEILGKDFLGPEAVKNVFGVELESIPPIQFTKEDLERAKELGQQLILQIDKMEDGKLINIRSLKDKFPEDHNGGRMWSLDKYNKIDFIGDKNGESPRVGWRLVSKNIIPGSYSKNYLGQTEAIIQYLKEKVFKDRELPKEYKEAIDEFESQKSEISEDINGNRVERASVLLENLKIVRLTKETPSEVMYRIVLVERENKEELFKSSHTSTSSLCSSHRGMLFVNVGFNKGFEMTESTSKDGYSGYGTSFSRSL